MLMVFEVKKGRVLFGLRIMDCSSFTRLIFYIVVCIEIIYFYCFYINAVSSSLLYIQLPAGQMSNVHLSLLIALSGYLLDRYSELS